MKSTSLNNAIIVPELEAMMTGGGTCHKWSEREDAVMRRYYGRVDTRALAKQLGRSVSAMYKHAHSIGVRYDDAELLSPNDRLHGREGSASE